MYILCVASYLCLVFHTVHPPHFTYLPPRGGYLGCLQFLIAARKAVVYCELPVHLCSSFNDISLFFFFYISIFFVTDNNLLSVLDVTDILDFRLLPVF